CYLLRRKRGSVNPSVVQRFPPERVKVRARMLLSPVALHDLMIRRFGLPGKQRDKFINTLAAIERSNQGLHNAHGAVVRTSIAPRFKIMRFVHMPLAEFGGLVLIKAEVYTKW